MGSYGSIILIVVMIIAFYFLIMRPQRRRQQQQAALINAIEPGSRVVTTTGIYATVVAVGDKQIVLETAPGTRVTMLKQAVGRVVQDGEEDASLAGYRGGVAAEQPGQGTGEQTDEQTGAESDQAQPGASGMAGGAPIQEYAPGSAPDFSAPDFSAPEGEGNQQPHETAPWPPYGSSQGSSLGDSSLGRKDDDSSETKENDTDR